MEITKAHIPERIYANRHRIVFWLFLTIHAAACIFTNYFGDDYYYAAFLRNGADYMISENIAHYLYGNGRALVHLVDQLLLGVSFWFWRVAAVAVMASLVIVSARLAARTYRKEYDPEQYKNAIVAVCAILAVTDIAILRQSVYWATGSLNYLFPAAFTLWFIYWIRRDFETGRGSWWLLIPAFFSSATTEQASAASLLAVLWIIVSAILQKRRLRPAWFGCFLMSLGGFLTLMLAPGSAARTQYYPDFYNMSLFRRILSNVKPLSMTVFGPDGMYALIIIMLAVTAYRWWKRSPLLALIPVASIGFYAYALTRRRELFEQLWFIGLLVLPLAVIFIQSAVDYFRKREMDNLFFVWGAVAMQCAMALTPEYGPRTLTMSVALLAIPAARALIEEKENLLHGLLAAAVFAILPTTLSDPLAFFIALLIGAIPAVLLFARRRGLISVLAVVTALAFFVTVPAGYAQNVPTLMLNREQIKAYDPACGEPLVLYYLPNYYYKYTMPYDDLYHQHVLMLLCGFPADTPVVYEFPAEQ